MRTRDIAIIVFGSVIVVALVVLSITTYNLRRQKAVQDCIKAGGTPIECRVSVYGTW